MGIEGIRELQMYGVMLVRCSIALRDCHLSCQGQTRQEATKPILDRPFPKRLAVYCATLIGEPSSCGLTIAILY